MHSGAVFTTKPLEGTTTVVRRVSSSARLPDQTFFLIGDMVREKSLPVVPDTLNDRWNSIAAGAQARSLELKDQFLNRGGEA